VNVRRHAPARRVAVTLEATDDLVRDEVTHDGRGFDPAQVVAPTLILHGGRDRVVPSSHGEWLARRCPSAQLWLYPDDGHISVLGSGAASAMCWLRERADEG
jgi:pimeloyl-ACP methyl ester carboxylesterase